MKYGHKSEFRRKFRAGLTPVAGVLRRFTAEVYIALV